MVGSDGFPNETREVGKQNCYSGIFLMNIVLALIMGKIKIRERKKHLKKLP